jgi:hypothetical protein
MKPPDMDLIGGGGISPYLILWRDTCSGWPSAPNGDPGSTQILTRHYGAHELGDHVVWQVPTVQPLRVINTPEDRVSENAAPQSDNSDGTVELH